MRSSVFIFVVLLSLFSWNCDIVHCQQQTNDDGFFNTIGNFFTDAFDAVSDFFSNFNLSLVNFGGNVESVEEVDLRWVKAGRSWRNGKINWSNNSNSSFSRESVSLNFLFNFKVLKILPSKN